ncbi:Eukaryotic translation initiation factor 3 subunit M [Hypsibius exemplaris]|uniref:Eukaryotic translation initiation factor 3 subunit M n=1 Tax=Hypsibius exemplaris TaxID=2072580 RepID=A0A1W0X779_HYPEX|nr:Eukaryotic translation initiation factor 3 subunit M [Hypsibius exemplaris]
MKSASIPVFPAKSLADLVIDIAQFFKNELRGEITVPEKDNQSDMILTIFSLVESSHLALKVSQESQYESLLNGILTTVLCFELPDETREKLVHNLANKLADLSSAEHGMKFVGARLRVLSTLLYGLDETSAVRYTPYCRLLELAAATSYLHRIPTDPSKVKAWITSWKLDDSRVRILWRTLHAALIKTGEITKASRVMVELLKTFTSDTAGEAKEEAFQCVRDAVGDPYAVSLDHLLSLKPVQHLKGQPVYQLLTIFVGGDVAVYMEFHQKNGAALEKMGLSHEANLKKIRLLTFLNLCRGRQEISHAEIEKALVLGAGDVEDFLIEALKTRLISGKIDAAQRRFRVTTCIEPSFSKAKWQELRDGLGTWQSQVRHLKRMLVSVTNPDSS